MGALGGTIAMRSTGSGASPAESAHSLVAAVPGLAQVAQVDARTLLNVPSASLEIPTLLALVPELERACADGAAGVVLTLGTDTMEEVAYLFDLLWRRPEPLVLTGAMRPADAPSADGPANLLAAATVAVSREATDRGCLVVMNDEVHSARWVRKTHTSSTAAFTSPVTGPTGRVSEGRVHFHTARTRRNTLAAEPTSPLPRVGLVRLTLGAAPDLLEQAAGFYDGLVVEAFGAGHVASWWVEPLTRLAAGRPVVLASRTGAGPVLTETYDFPGAETGLLRSGLIPAGDLDGLKARILLTLTMMTTERVADVAQLFRQQTRPDMRMEP